MALAPKRKRPLSFELEATGNSNGERVGLILTETGSESGDRFAVSLNPAASDRIQASLMAALRQSRLKPGELSPRRRKPLVLSEDAGVRLALTMVATKPVSRRKRIIEIEEGVTTMSTEETFYWYAKCTGPDGRRSQRALRLLLSGE